MRPVRNYMNQMHKQYGFYCQDELLSLTNIIPDIVISLGNWSVMHHSMNSYGTDFFISNDVKDVEVNCMVNCNICGIYEANQESGGLCLTQDNLCNCLSTESEIQCKFTHRGLVLMKIINYLQRLCQSYLYQSNYCYDKVLEN